MPVAAIRDPEEMVIPRCSCSALRAPAGDRSYGEMEDVLAAARPLLEGHAIWHVTASTGGGAAEVLHSLLGYIRDGGIDANWAALHTDGHFLPIAKRLYDGLYGAPASGLELSDDDRAAYEDALASAAAELGELIDDGDIVVLHDPPTAGMIAPLRERGARVAWRCHLGMDEPNSTSQAARRFLLPYVERADAVAFSRREFVWPELDAEEVWVIAPSINPLSAKNQPMDPVVVGAILNAIGLTAGGSEAVPTFTRLDGSPSRVDSAAIVEQQRPIPSSSSVVAHVSAWDRLKDPGGLIACFAEHCEGEVDLVLAGPDPGVPDGELDSERVWDELVEQVRELPSGPRRRVHLVGLPVADREESAAIVNAIERRAAVVVRKSFAEGFGLTLAEAMWKETPVVATRVGGIQDLVVDGESGLLVDDPDDHEAFADAVRSLISDRGLAMRLAAAGRERVRERYLITRHMRQYLELAMALAEG